MNHKWHPFVEYITLEWDTATRRYDKIGEIAAPDTIVLILKICLAANLFSALGCAHKSVKTWYSSTKYAVVVYLGQTKEYVCFLFHLEKNYGR